MAKKKQTVELFIKSGVDNKPEIPRLELYLEKNDDGVCLMAKDGEGDVWYVVRINANGTIKRYANLPDNIGLQLDKNDKILEEK